MKHFKISCCSADELPFDCWTEILLFIDDFNDIISFRLTCKYFNNLCTSKGGYKGTDNAKLMIKKCLNPCTCSCSKNIIKNHNFGLLKNIEVSYKDIIKKEWINKLVNIKNLKLSPNYTWKSNRLIKRLMVFDKLSVLEIPSCDLDNDDVKLLEKFKLLHTLNISFNAKITGSTFNSIKQVKSLDISFLCKVPSKNLTFFSDLHSLTIVGCTQLEDIALKNLKGLKFLNMSFCSNITDKGLLYLKNLEKIIAWWCSSITEDGLLQLGKIKYKDVL